MQHTKTAIAVKGDPGYKGGGRRKYAPDPLNVHIMQKMIRSLTFSSRPSPPAYPSQWPHRQPCGGTSNLRSLCPPKLVASDWNNAGWQNLAAFRREQKWQ